MSEREGPAPNKIIGAVGLGDPWAPIEAPTSPHARKTSTRQTVIVWAVLVVMFVAIYSLMGGEEHARDGYSGWWIAGAAVAGALLVFLFVLLLVRGAKQFNAAQEAGLEALAERDYAQAAEQFAKLARRYRTRPQFAAFARYNHGVALLRGGDSATAAGIFRAVEGDVKLTMFPGVRRLAAFQLGRCFALGGDVAKARQWLDAIKRRGSGLDNPSHDRAMVDGLEGLVLCREGKLDEAQRLYEQSWNRMTEFLQMRQMTEPLLLRAYAIASKGPRDAGAAEPYLRMLRSMSTRDVEWLTKHWPELAAFASTQLASAQAA
jgi:tetratricopeptide (TPR) repeat protein